MFCVDVRPLFESVQAVLVTLMFVFAATIVVGFVLSVLKRKVWNNPRVFPKIRIFWLTHVWSQSETQYQMCLKKISGQAKRHQQAVEGKKIYDRKPGTEWQAADRETIHNWKMWIDFYEKEIAQSWKGFVYLVDVTKQIYVAHRLSYTTSEYQEIETN